MDAPFTASQFLEVFGRYNAAVWPAQVVFYGLAFLMIYWAARGAGRWVHAILAFLWAWMGVVYHWLFFTEIQFLTETCCAGHGLWVAPKHGAPEDPDVFGNRESVQSFLKHLLREIAVTKPSFRLAEDSLHLPSRARCMRKRVRKAHRLVTSPGSGARELTVRLRDDFPDGHLE
jgi:hypothetical protein